MDLGLRLCKAFHKYQLIFAYPHEVKVMENFS